MNIRDSLLAALIAFSVFATGPTESAATEAKDQITILYDAFGTNDAMTKDWGFSALVEIAGKRILFDTGNDPEIFAANVKAKGVDLSDLDFVVLSHRHSDHMAGLSYLLSINPTVKIYAPKEGFGVYGSSLPSGFYRKDEGLPPEMRYYAGKPPAVMKFGTAWAHANFELIDQTTEIVPGITLISLISDTPGTRELKELSLAVNTADGVVLLVGCSHPGIERIVEAATGINPRIHLIAGGFHLVVAPDKAIAKVVTALKDRFKVDSIAPGHCTGEPTFAALKKAFGDNYLYAGLGTSIPVGAIAGANVRRGEGPTLDDLATYRKLARHEDPFGILQLRSLRLRSAL
ncbi:MBL fold metallo-hydrolase [Bradyrhizobium sp. SSUT18]|uniref:MBL fold metallo-hydrolase n=1 Tax=unclassified Bradyrhizobium TaxID=2631580 RepID=UPI0024471639|nr:MULTISPECIES: MBL fold metallo-hydrolase [unclassified Bradyrhizobium]MDH2350687.1 MBL fold metallo-hydrolase [Bradyrhizobium sp. SSUT112]MDH2401563.1 MBL fold metallo-hydrolase [Bradyrhizobium sp. SSUT18]